jgi:hypothetical protein
LITANATNTLREKQVLMVKLYMSKSIHLLPFLNIIIGMQKGTSTTNSECTSKDAGILLSGLLEVSLSNIYGFRSVY